MALTSPGVEVTIIDQSQYLPAPTGTIPLVVIATAENKANPNGTGVAAGTTAANANKLFQVTSQRDLTTIYGTPFFYTTTNGTPIQGYELNEYGLLAAYSVLGVTNRAYVLRADIDLASLVGSLARPSGNPDDGDYWLDTTSSNWGIFAWNATTEKFTEQQPIVINDSADLSGDVPLQTLGVIGSYAVNAIEISELSSQDSPKQYFYKNSNNEWVVVGSQEWCASIPTIQSTESNPSLITGTFTLILSGENSATITISAGNTVYDVATSINALAWNVLSANVVDGKLEIYSSQLQPGYMTTPLYVGISSGTAGLLSALGITSGNYFQPISVYGTSAQMPLWGNEQTYPRPTNSVWIKIGSTGNGLNESISKYQSLTDTWSSQTITYASSLVGATTSLDPSGGQNIPAGTLVAQYTTSFAGYSFDRFGTSPILVQTRLSTGPTNVVGSVDNPTITNAGTVTVYVSQPNSSTLLGPYYVTVSAASDQNDFVTAWATASIPYTTASVTTNGAVAISHTLGGEIMMADNPVGSTFLGDITGDELTVTTLFSGKVTNTALTSGDLATPLSVTGQISGQPGGVGVYQLSASLGSPESGIFIGQFPTGYGESAEILSDLGFIANSTDFVIDAASQPIPYLLEPSDVQPPGGSGFYISLLNQYGYSLYNGVGAAGTGYSVGDELTFDGTEFGGTSPANDVVFKVTNVSVTGEILRVVPVSGIVPDLKFIGLSNWGQLTYTANPIAPVNLPLNNTNWFYSTVDQVDIMVNTTTGWKGYKNVQYNQNGFPVPGGSFNTDPNGPIVSPTEPTTQSDGTPLVYGDLWINTTDLELYPVINRWQNVDGTDSWVLIDNTDQVTSTGIVFADARWSSSGSIDPVNDPIPTIKSLLTSDYIDLDAPNDSLYPVGMLLFNTRRSGYNVKQFRTNVFTQSNYPDAGAYDPLDPTDSNNLPQYSYTWVSTSGLQSNGAPYMGRKAQRAMVVQALRNAIDTNTDIRDEDNTFNLIATPNYPELQPNMVVLNSDRGETGYILGDTPMGLSDSATAIQNWATNAAGATSTGEDGCVTRNTYLGLFYPSGIAADLSGNLVAVPASHMMLRTFVRNDTIAYPWLAAAGTRRGIIDNAANIGYLNRTTGEFQVIKTRIGIRDVLYTNFINPLVFFTGNGLLNYGNKTSFNSQSALDRTNVARLVAYIRRQLTVAARPFVFEPNDALTRQQIAGVVESLMIDLVAKRGIYDYLVVCDESNNTPARIDRNELWVDVAIEPVKAAEFIYIPVRILNTGELAAA